jgi:biopolymer transport protein ExbD
MRRFSQRSALVTLNEINITPLLDLAFVLLIIFVITTPLLENGFKLNLPQGTAQDDKKIDPKDIRTVDITPEGAYRLNKHEMSIEQVEANLVKDFQANRNLVVYIRADEKGRIKGLATLLERCQRNGITRYSLRTEPIKR